MKDKVRIVLVDPSAKSRQEFQRQLGSIGEVEVVEVCGAYQPAVKRLAHHMPSVAILGVDEDFEEALGLIENLSQSYPGIALLPAGGEKDASDILRVIRAGAREYLPIPCSTIDLVEAIRRLCPKAQQGERGPRGPRVIAVTGAAGGVGCTSLAVNLASSISKLSQCDTVIADFDLLLGSLEECLAVIPDNSLEVVIKNIDDLDPSLLKRWLPRHQSGLYVLPHPVSMEDGARIEADQLRLVLDLLKESFETVVVDTSKGLQVTDFVAFEMADIIVVVLQLNVNCTRNTVRLLQYLRMYEGLAEKIRLVVNRLNSPLSEISLKKAEELLKCPVTWQVPNATWLFRPGRSLGVPIDEVDGGEGSKAHQAMVEIAKALQPFPVEQVQERRRLFGAFR
ncbi:MAG: pilus assembly protein CpaF [Isosphaeraceae bacterium]